MKKITFSIPWPFTAEEMRYLLGYTFQVALVLYLGLYILEYVRPGFVTLFYNLDDFFWAALVTGIVSSLWPTLTSESKLSLTHPNWKNSIWIGLLALATTAVIWYQLHLTSWPGLLIAPLSGLIVLGICLLVIFDGDDENDA